MKGHEVGCWAADNVLHLNLCGSYLSFSAWVHFVKIKLYKCVLFILYFNKIK